MEFAVYVKAYVDGKLVAVKNEFVTHIPSETTADDLAADVFRAARRTVTAVEQHYNNREGATHG